MENKSTHIGSVANRLNVSQRTVRYYEELGLISSERTEGGYRVFSETQIEKLKTILALKDIGMSLDEIKKFLSLRQHGMSGSETAGDLLDYLKKKTAEIKQAIEKYSSLAKELEEVTALVENCKCCHHETSEGICEKCVDDRTNHHVPPLMKTLL